LAIGCKLGPSKALQFKEKWLNGYWVRKEGLRSNYVANMQTYDNRAPAKAGRAKSFKLTT
jgi:hypothetical protein